MFVLSSHKHTHSLTHNQTHLQAGLLLVQLQLLLQLGQLVVQLQHLVGLALDVRLQRHTNLLSLLGAVLLVMLQVVICGLFFGGA